jgi:hypothetical protein
MRTVLLSVLLQCISFAAYSSVDLLVLGDSQTGATWSKSYFGNYLQMCLKDQVSETGDFVIYGRGGTQPQHWVKNKGLDKIETIQRDQDNNHKNIGSLEAVPLEKKRIGPMLQTLQPKKVLLFFGDNLLVDSHETILGQFKEILSFIKSNKISSADCFLLTPTFEMEVKSKRNVTYKNIENTKKVIAAIKIAAVGSCQVIDGLEVMKESPYYLSPNLLKRVDVAGRNGCTGGSSNDNIHICGESARYLAQAVCNKLKN